MEDATRWGALFADLEGQWEAEQAAELAEEVGERVRLAWLQIALVERLRSCHGHDLAVAASGLGTVRGRLEDSGPDWLLLGAGAPAPCLVALGAVAWIRGLGEAAVTAAAAGPLATRWTLRLALRALAEQAEPVRVVLRDGTALPGRLSRVGADHLDVAADTGNVRTVPVAALAAVLSAAFSG